MYLLLKDCLINNMKETNNDLQRLKDILFSENKHDKFFELNNSIVNSNYIIYVAPFSNK